MKRITTLIVSMLLIASSVWARTPEEAAAIASGFMSQKGTDASVVQRVQRAKSTGVAQSTVSLEYIQVTKANDNAVYVFNHTDGGFVLVSAIDNSREVLGYNDNGRFDKNNIPKNMQFWLQMYADELASVDKTATRSVSAKAATSTYTAVSPILDCIWGQSWPYNEMCPTIGSGHAVTGCVATAISQIMYAHKHPAKGTGSHSYTSETNNITSSVNFGSTTYDWNNMLPYYDWDYQENYTDAEVSAVATLLYHVGVSSNMDYGVDGSGAYSGESLYNMTEYFDYDKAINPMSKDVMPEADILTAISNDLQLGRPVYISGSTVNNEGHAFVCDGIRQDGYLHINWGWDGYSDGYFALSALNPEDQGTGGSSDNSAFTQLVVVYSNIKPDEGGAAVSYITCDSYTRTSGNTLTLGASNVNYRLTTLMNNGLVAADGSIYYDIYNSSNQLQHSLPVMEIGLAPNYYYTNALTLAETLPSSMANGEYQLEVCYHDANGNIFPIWVAGLGELPRVAFSVSGNTAYFGEEVELNEFTIRVKKGASCDMYTSDGLYLWWWVTNQDGQLANLTLNADGWYTTTITSTASSINCLVVNTDVVNNGWGGHQQTIDYTDITGDICLEIGAPDENNYYDIYETSCEEEFIPASSYHDFSNETNNAQWHFAQDGQANYWTIGWGADVINPTLYITMDGDTYDYLEGTSSTSWAYIPVTLTETDQISFNWQGAGELNYDYLSVYLCPADWHPTSGSTTIPSDAIRLAHNLCEASQWQEEVCTPNVSGAYYLCFMWSNDASVGNGTPIMIDNVRYGTPEVSTVPTAEDLAEYEQDGYFVACINFQGEVCNDIVFAGSYNSWNTNPEDMVHFTPLDGFDGWYVAVVPVVYDEYGAEANDGKPVQLASDGTFSWDYQTGDFYSWELISGSVDIMSGYSGESNLTNWSSAEPVILKSLYFKNNNSPCGDIVTYDYTINLKAPDCGGYEPAIIGDFNNWVEGVAMAPIGDGWYQAVVNSMPGRRVNFRASTSADWSNAIQIYDSEYGAWLNIADYYLTEETTINLDYSAGKYTLCENDVPTPECYTLNVNVAEGGYVNISPEADCYEEGTQITLTAEAYEGYQFSQWSDGNTDNPRLLTMTEDIYLTAVFTYTPIEEHSYTIRVKKDDVSDMDLSNGLYLWWWYNDQAGQLANMTLGDDGWYTTTITTTANSINCLAVNTDVVNNDWTGQQTIDYTNITGDVCLAIGAQDWIYNYKYNLYEIPCSPMEYTTEHDFEDTEANAQWRFVQNGQTNYWTIGSAAGSMDSGSNALYITSDGNNYTYNNNASSTSWAYIPVTVTVADSITFYWKGEGESDYDNLRVYLFPKGYTPIAGNTSIPNSAIQLGEYLSGQTDWQYFSAMAGVEGEYNLCLRWHNDGSYGEMPIAVDNMAITTPLNTTEYPLTYVLDEDGTATVAKCATDYSGDVSIPNVVTYNGTTYTVTSIGDNAFKECGYLTSVTIPNSVTSIGRMAFAYCWSLESVTLSENISSIEDYTFYDCESLTSITIPNNVTYVGNYAFGYCHNLSAVTFGNNVTTIDNYAFAYCWSLESVTIPASVSYIGYSTFVSCNSLNSIVVESGNTAYDSRNNCNAIIETASNTLITGCQSTIIPETVTTIGDEAFYNCDGLTTIAIPNSVTSIGYYAFANCDNLSSVDLGNGVTTISGSAFEYCYAMTSVTIPASVTEIGSWAFYYCPTIVMEGTTPPTISSSTFKSEATIFVPCTALDTYLATSVWQDLNLRGSNYTVTLSATEGGYAQITASDCATNTVTIEAYPEERYVFTQWSDGNTDNPRILTLTEDIALTAEFTILTYPVTNLVVTTNCGTAYASWESDAPYFEVAAFDASGNYVLYGITNAKNGVSNANPFSDGEYIWQVTPLYSDSYYDYAGDAVQAAFTISSDNCVDLNVYNLAYTIDGETVNITWESEAPLYHIWMYDYNYNVLEEKFIDGKNYSITLSEVGKYHFGIRGNNVDATQYSSYSELDIDFVNAEIPYDLNFTNGYVRGYGANNKEIHLFSQDGNTHLRLDLYSDYDNSILGTYIVRASYTSGDCSTEYSNISYKGITSDSFVSGVVTVMRDNEDNYVISFDVTEGKGKMHANACTISSEFLTSYDNEDFTGIGVTALTASEALELTQSLEHTDMTTIPYFVSGVISHMRNTPEEIVLYTRARFDISDDGTTNNQFYCYNTKWLNNSDFTTGHEIALGDNVVVYGNLQNYLGTTPEIKGYIYQHYPEGTDAPTPCYILVVDATEGGHVNISPEADCYEEGTEVTLTAEAYEGYQFTQWSDGSTENPRVLTITEYTTLTAQFSRLTYPVSDLVITTDCGFAHVSWTSDAPYYEVSVFNSNGETVVYGIIDFNKNCSNVDPLDAGEYIWQVIPMYSTAEGDYAGDAVQLTFTINLDGCIDPEIYDLTYTTTNDSIVNVTWVSEAPLFQVWMYDSFGELLNSEFLNGNNYCDTLSETGVYQFQIRSVDADTMYYTSPAYYLDINITIPETPCYTLAVNANDGGNVSVSPLAECYEAGTQVVITATPNENYEFVTWSDGNTSAQRTIVMDKDYNLTATFRSTSIPTNNYTLTLTCDEGGTVGKNPNYEYYEENTIVTIFANANEGYEFIQWSDGNTESVRSITITQDMVLHATFVEEQKEQFSLTITADEGGTVTTIPNQDTYDAGTIVAVIANANDGYEFVRWSDGITDNVRSVTMTQDITLHATFVAKQKEQYTLSLTAGEGGSVTKTPDQPSYEDGTSVDIAAIANDGYEFVTWSDGNTSAQRTIIMDRDYSFTAIFQSTSVPADYYTLILTCDEGGTVRKSPDREHYEVNTVVTIFAQANEGYDFVKWSDGNTDSIRTITMTQNIALHAIFVAEPKPQYVVSVTASEGGTVTKTPNQELYDEGTTVIIIAQANNGYEFAEWSDGNKNSVRSIVVTDHVVLQAIFVAKQTEQFTLTLTASEGGTAIKVPDQASYNAGSTVTIIAQANDGYEFVQWSDGNTENVRSITMTQDMVLHATFVEEQKELFTLTLTAGEGGTVTKTPDQPSYAAGSVVTITAQANEGFEFVSWSDGDKNSVRNITMTQNVELNATFKRIASNYDITNLSVTSSNKRITAKWESIATRFEIVITDRNNEVEHSEKVDITDDSKVYKYTAKKLGTYTVTIKPLNASDQQIGIEDSKTVTLVMKYSLFISTENENAGTVNEEVNGDYVDGETVEIVATPKNGYRFKMWDDGDTNAKRTLVMNQDYYLTASFSRIPTYTLTISEGENGLASMAAGSYTYKENEEVTIIPLPYDGYVFDHWVVNGIENTTETLTLVMTQDYSVYPVCVSKPIPTYTLTILPGEYGKANMEAGTYTYQEGEEVTLLPIADTDYLFDQWVVNDEVNTDSVLVLVMDKDYTVMPTFIPNQVGVENIYDGITILVEQWTITVEATQAQDIALYDLVGHLIEQQPHTRIASFTVPSAGLYLIRTSSGVKKVRVE